MVLSAQLEALNAEANEARRHETEEDWLRDQASRAEALRESRRADPTLRRRWSRTGSVRPKRD